MANILIFPLPEFGHIAPTLRLAKHLSSLGHCVVYLTAPQFLSQITLVGAAIEPLIAQDSTTEQFSGSHIWHRFAPDSSTVSRGSRLRDVVARIMIKYDFSLVICDRILAINYRSALITLIGKNRIILFSTSLFNWREDRTDGLEVPTLIFCPDCFEVPKFRLAQEGHFYVESSLKPLALETSIECPLINGVPLVLTTFGTQSARYRDSDERFGVITSLAERRTDLYFVLATGSPRMTSRLLASRVLPNVMVRDRVPQRRLLQRTSVMITHGGLGSVKESIHEGVPMVVLPNLHDQPFNAMRVRHGGLGSAIFPNCLSLESLERAIDSILEGRYTEALTEMRAKFIGMEQGRLSHLLVSNQLAST